MFWQIDFSGGMDVSRDVKHWLESTLDADDYKLGNIGDFVLWVTIYEEHNANLFRLSFTNKYSHVKFMITQYNEETRHIVNVTEEF